ncbi:helix-turn-helix domain-containing protein [Sphingomonas sp. C8-2]|jgi:transcriptional regulator GlxA family with amidase domain|nr:helix-turn-helix domain-containing protein [Sphingomonas sp. C8-2]
MLATTILALETALASSVTITIDVLAMANHVCRAEGRPPAFDVRLTGPGAHLFRPFLAFPEVRHEAAELFVIPAQGFSKADDYVERLGRPDVVAAQGIVAEAIEGGAQVASSCTGTLLLAGTGALDNRRATTAWWLAPTVQELFPAVLLDTTELVTTDGPFTTAGAAMAQMDLMVGLVARHAGAEIAEGCARRMLLDERRSQIPYMAVGLLAASSESVERAVAWARPRLGQGIGVSDIAAATAQSPRTFSRRVTEATGLSPIQFLQQLRVEEAIKLIETTALPFEEIACRVGYADPSTLRGLIRRGGGLGPRELRARARSRRARERLPLTRGIAS